MKKTGKTGSLTCRTALCWGLGESSLSTSSLGAGRMLDSQVLAVITFSLEELLAWPWPRPGAEFSLSLWSSPFVIYTQSVSPGEGGRRYWHSKK